MTLAVVSRWGVNGEVAMNPWKIIGWIVLALMLVSLTFCGLVCVRVAQTDTSKLGGATRTGKAAPGNPHGNARLYLKSITCDANYGRPRADLVFENNGGVDLEYAQAYVSFGGKIHEGFINPTKLPQGSLGTITVYGAQGESAACVLERVQDRDGDRIQVLNSGG